jgi:hypothetical protein
MNMKNNTPRPRTRIINPNFPIPDGLEGMIYEDEDFIGDEEDFVDAVEGGESEETAGNDDTVPVPEGFVIISQSLRIQSDGSKVVDVVIGVEEIKGIENYELRVTKR